jgi:hypothetical protein
MRVIRVPKRKKEVVRDCQDCGTRVALQSSDCRFVADSRDGDAIVFSVWHVGHIHNRLASFEVSRNRLSVGSSRASRSRGTAGIFHGGGLFRELRGVAEPLRIF